MYIADPRNPAFWNAEYQRLWDMYGEIAIKILMDGATQGASLLPAGIDLLIDWDTFNVSAINWLKTYGLSSIYGINRTTQERVVDIIGSWIQRGEPLPVLENQLSVILGRPRAEMIATTEVTRVYAEGNIQAWKATGVVGGKRWQTAVDDRVCSICAPLHNKVVQMDYGWSADEGGNIIQSGEGLLSPPAHVRCRCWLQPVVDEDLFRKRMREEIARA